MEVAIMLKGQHEENRDSGKEEASPADSTIA